MKESSAPSGIQKRGVDGQDDGSNRLPGSTFFVHFGEFKRLAVQFDRWVTGIGQHRAYLVNHTMPVEWWSVFATPKGWAGQPLAWASVPVTRNGPDGSVLPGLGSTEMATCANVGASPASR